MLYETGSAACDTILRKLSTVPHEYLVSHHGLAVRRKLEAMADQAGPSVRRAVDDTLAIILAT